MGADIRAVCLHEFGVHWVRGDRIGRPTGRKGTIVGILCFSVCLGGGGRIFCGGGGIAVVVPHPGGVLGTDLHEVLVF